MLYENIRHLVDYGIRTGLTPECERIYTTNLLLDLFHEDNYEEPEAVAYGSPDLDPHRYRQLSGKNMLFPQKKQRTIIINSVRTVITSAATA